MKILVTGAAGNLARNGLVNIFPRTAKKFHGDWAADDQLIGVDIVSDASKIPQGYTSYHVLDITDGSADWSPLKDVGVVINAFMTGTGDFEMARKVNVGGIETLCKKMAEYGVPRIVHCGTMNEYGPGWHSIKGLNEDLSQFPFSPNPQEAYGVKKMRTIPALKSQRDTRNAKAFLRRRGFYVRIFRLKSRSKERGFGPSDF